MDSTIICESVLSIIDLLGLTSVALDHAITLYSQIVDIFGLYRIVFAERWIA